VVRVTGDAELHAQASSRRAAASRPWKSSLQGPHERR
jgi:hypothetical protein